MSTYCDYAASDPLHRPYHDKEYGFPELREDRLFERLVMEIMQAGLNWGLILKKRDSMARAFDGYEVDRVAEYGEVDVARLLADGGIVRNRLKVNAVIHNAGVVRSMRESHGGFAAWIEAGHPKRKKDWVKLFRKTFKFTGGEITNEFLMSIGYLPGTHRPDCPVYREIEMHDPAWMQIGASFYAECE